MSNKPVSTIVRSDAPHLVEVKPGSLNASSTKSWVEAGELNPGEHIPVVELREEHSHQTVIDDAKALVENRQHLAPEEGPMVNRQAIHESPLPDVNHQPLSHNPINDHRIGVPDVASTLDHRVSIPSASSHDDVTSIPQEVIRDHREALPDGHITDHRVTLPQDAHSNLASESAPTLAASAPGPVLSRVQEQGSVPASQPIERSAHAPHPPLDTVPPPPHPPSTVHLTQDPESFKSRVAAIRDSVSHIAQQLDELKK